MHTIRILTFAVLAAWSLAATPHAGYAQPSGSPQWHRHVEHQLARLLVRLDGKDREDVMRLIIQLRDLHGEMLDLSACGPYLVEVYRTETDEQQRILAIAALYATRNVDAIGALSAQVQSEPPSRARLQAQRMLAVHHAERS